MLETELVAFGLTPRQVRLYLALMQRQESSAGALSSELGMPRLTAYSALERLRQMGLVSFYERQKTRFYRVNPPESLVRFCEMECQQSERRKRRVMKALPALKSFYQAAVWSDLPGPHAFNSFHDASSFYAHALPRLKGVQAWWAVHAGGLWPVLHRFCDAGVVEPRCLIPSGAPVSARFGRGLIRSIPKRFCLTDFQLLAFDDTLWFLYERDGFFSAFELTHAFTARHVVGLLRCLWESKGASSP